MPIHLSLEQARHLQLAAQDLLTSPERAATRLSLRRCIERMQLLQIDTISVVARSPYLVLFSRLGGYPQYWLDDALAAGHLFELWAHEACFAPVQHLAHHRSHNHWWQARPRLAWARPSAASTSRPCMCRSPRCAAPARAR